MAVIPVNSIVEIRVYCRFGTQFSINVRHYRTNAIAGTGGTDIQAAAAFESALNGDYKTILPTTAEWWGVSAQIIRPLPPLVPQFNSVNRGAGVVAGDPLPPATAGLITLRTAVATRKGRGRIYLPFPGEADNAVTGSPGGAYIIAADTIATTYIATRVIGAGGNTSTLVSVIYNRATGATIDVTAFQTRTAWAQQRRRSLLRRGDVAPF